MPSWLGKHCSWASLWDCFLKRLAFKSMDSLRKIHLHLMWVDNSQSAEGSHRSKRQKKSKSIHSLLELACPSPILEYYSSMFTCLCTLGLRPEGPSIPGFQLQAETHTINSIYSWAIRLDYHSFHCSSAFNGISRTKLSWCTNTLISHLVCLSIIYHLSIHPSTSQSCWFCVTGELSGW